METPPGKPLARLQGLPVKMEGGQKERFFLFSLGDAQYAFEAGQTVEVLKDAAITQVPSTPAFIKGIIVLRAEMLAVVDLKKRLGIEGRADDGKTVDSRILVAGADGMKAAFIVDAAAGVIEVSPRLLEARGGDGDDVFVKGVMRVHGRVVRVLSPEKLLDTGA